VAAWAQVTPASTAAKNAIGRRPSLIVETSYPLRVVSYRERCRFGVEVREVEPSDHVRSRRS
jgi:hypothetical protein